MKKYCCSIRIYVDEYPSVIKGSAMFDLVDEISSLLQCEYNNFGYTLLDPDYDYKDVGIVLKNDLKSREYFSQMVIPDKYYGKEEPDPAAPVIKFESHRKETRVFSAFSVKLDYPVYSNQYLAIEIDVEKELSEKLTLLDFKKIQNIIVSKGYTINSAFIHYFSFIRGYKSDKKRMVLEGIQMGIMTINDLRMIDRFIKFQMEWKNKIPGIFFMNSVKKECMSDSSIKEITKIVGEENVMECGNQFMFQFPQKKLESVKNIRRIKKILEKEKVYNKDSSIIKCILE